MTSYPTVTLSRREIDDLKTRSSVKAKVWKGRS